MIFSFAFVLMAVVFFVQLLLCKKAKRLWSKLIPMALLVLGELACLTAYMASLHVEQTGKDIHGAAFAAVIYGIVLLYFLAADALAWAVSAIISLVRKRKK